MANIKEKTTVLSAQDIKRTLYRLSHEIIERNPDINSLVLLGIQTRGAFLAKRIQSIIKEIESKELPLGILDITLYRDDLTDIGPSPLVKETKIDFDINSKKVILIDDVLFTGRTIRAALSEIMDFGRPKKVELLVLVDRGHRELPIRADFVGKNVPTSADEKVEIKVSELDKEDKAVILEESK